MLVGNCTELRKYEGVALLINHTHATFALAVRALAVQTLVAALIPWSPIVPLPLYESRIVLIPLGWWDKVFAFAFALWCWAFSCEVSRFPAVVASFAFSFAFTLALTLRVFVYWIGLSGNFGSLLQYGDV